MNVRKLGSDIYGGMIINQKSQFLMKIALVLVFPTVPYCIAKIRILKVTQGEYPVGGEVQYGHELTFDYGIDSNYDYPDDNGLDWLRKYHYTKYGRQ